VCRKWYLIDQSAARYLNVNCYFEWFRIVKNLKSGMWINFEISLSYLCVSGNGYLQGIWIGDYDMKRIEWLYFHEKLLPFSDFVNTFISLSQMKIIAVPTPPCYSNLIENHINKWSYSMSKSIFFIYEQSFRSKKWRSVPIFSNNP